MSPDGAIQRILELSAEAQIKRRETAEDSPAFHNLTGAIEMLFGTSRAAETPLSSDSKMRASMVLPEKLRFVVGSKARIFIRRQFQLRCWSS